MGDNNNYNSEEQIKISFGRGTIFQAFDDRTIGGVNFGYDSDNDFGVTYIEGKLYSSKILDILISGDEGEKTILVKYVNESGYVAEKTYKTVDASIVEQMISAAQPEEHTYSEGEYIGIVQDPDNEKNFIVSVKYDELYDKIREDIINDIDVSAIQDDVDSIKRSYVKDIYKSEEDSNNEFVDTYVSVVKKNDSENYIDINVPKEEFYEQLVEQELATAAALIDLNVRKADKEEVYLKWKDVHDLLNEARNS